MLLSDQIKFTVIAPSQPKAACTVCPRWTGMAMTPAPVVSYWPASMRGPALLSLMCFMIKDTSMQSLYWLASMPVTQFIA